MHKTGISPSRNYAFQVLQSVLTDGKLLDEALEDTTPHSINENDRALAREIASGTCRHLEKIQYVLKQFAKKLTQFPPIVQRILELSTYQILFLDRVPDFAVVSDAVNLAKQKRLHGLSKAVNGILRNLIRQKDQISYPNRDHDFIEYLSVEYSHPKWMIEEWQSIWNNESIEELCKWNNTRAQLSLRIRGDIEEVKTVLQSNHIDVEEHPALPNIININSETVIDSSVYQNQMWVVQDPIMTLPALVMDPQPGYKIWDVCAAPGGKTFHIADLMKDNGTIVATDRSTNRLKRLIEQNEFLGYSSIQPLVLNPLHDTLPPEISGFDAILLDVPCTGWGTFRRNPDLRWRLKPDDSIRLGENAFQLLQCVSNTVKPGGVIVYSTCTLSPVENIEVIERFIRQNDSFRLEDSSPFIPQEWQNGLQTLKQSGGNCFTAFPPVTKTDGAFIARIRKKG